MKSTTAQNLVPNPSFEQLDTCPYQIGFAGGDRPLHWFSWLNTPDYFHACADTVNGVDTLVGVPWNGWTYQHAYDGLAYVGGYGFATGDPYREYVGTELLSPLQVGETYEVSFRVSAAADGSYWYTSGMINNIGLLFSTSSNAWTDPWPWPPGPDFGFRNFAHVYSTAIITDTASWTLVSGSFTADSAYTHLVLGNFFENALTDTAIFLPGASSVLAYWLIDQVCVSQGPEGCGVDSTVEEPNADGHLQVLVMDGGDLIVNWPGYSGFTCRVHDPSGRLLLERGGANSSVVLSTRSWAEGLYIVRVMSGSQSAFSKVVVTR